MFSFLYSDEKDNNGVEDAKIQKIPPLFNTKNIVEFSLAPDKRFLKLSDTQIKFRIEIPDNYCLDNDVFGKLIESFEININHEIITHKSSSVDHAITNFLLQKVTYGTGT